MAGLLACPRLDQSTGDRRRGGGEHGTHQIDELADENAIIGVRGSYGSARQLADDDADDDQSAMQLRCNRVQERVY